MGMMTGVRQFGVYPVTLDPTRGSEIRKTRPYLVVSPEEVNRHIRTVIIAPMTTISRPYPTRVPVHFQGKDGQIALDQIRTVDKAYLVKHLGDVSLETAEAVCSVLVELFTMK